MERADYIIRAEQFIRDSFKQAHIEAPWRKQVRFSALFLSGLVGAAILAWIYLSVSSQAATIGREIQGLRSDIKYLQQRNADMEAQIANHNSAAEMKNRAQKLDLQPIDPISLVYLIVPGYQKPEVNLSSQTNPIYKEVSKPKAPLMIPEYSQSWVDWLWQTIKTLEPLYGISDLMEVNP